MYVSIKVLISVSESFLESDFAYPLRSQEVHESKGHRRRLMKLF